MQGVCKTMEPIEVSSPASPADSGVPAAEDINNDSFPIGGQADGGVDDGPVRQGTISSARFNILCTMVGGGCLSLPMAFQKTGNGLFGPFLLVLTAMITEFCFKIIIATTRRLSPVHEGTTVIGQDSFESMTSAAFGSKGFLFAKGLVTAVS